MLLFEYAKVKSSSLQMFKYVNRQNLEYASMQELKCTSMLVFKYASISVHLR